MKILIASVLDAAAIEHLRNSHEVIYAPPAGGNDLGTLIEDREVLIFRSGVEITSEILFRAPHLRLILRAGCGLDNLDLDYVRKRQIELRTIPEPAAQAVAEMTFAFMLGLARRIYEADRLWRNGHWAKQSLEGYLLRGKTLGVVGVGNIGSRVGQLGSSFNMNVIGCVEYSSLRLEQAMARAGIRLTSFDEVVSSADFLSINVPLNDSTRNLIDAEVLKRMKPGAFLVNTARGGIVDELALYDQLLPGGRLRGAALDVHEHEGEGQISPLAALPNVLLTPHIAAMTVDTQREIGRRAVEIIADFAKKHDSDSLTSSLRVEEFSICETD